MAERAAVGAPSKPNCFCEAERVAGVAPSEPFCGGEGGIRTHGDHKGHNGFRDRPDRPLRHLSDFARPLYNKTLVTLLSRYNGAMSPFAQALLVFTFSFLVGSLPFSVWLGRLFLHRDIRAVGDGNPGTTNVIRAGSPFLGILVLLLDTTKGVIPPLLVLNLPAHSSLDLFLAGSAPVLGHAFSPFLKFRGGKALAVTLGTWIGLTIWQVPVAALAGVLLGRFFLDSEGWAVMLALASMLGAILFWDLPRVDILILLAQTFILIIKHRGFLRRPPGLHPRFRRVPA